MAAARTSAMDCRMLFFFLAPCRRGSEHIVCVRVCFVSPLSPHLVPTPCLPPHLVSALALRRSLVSLSPGFIWLGISCLLEFVIWLGCTCHPPTPTHTHTHPHTHTITLWLGCTCRARTPTHTHTHPHTHTITLWFGCTCRARLRWQVQFPPASPR